MRKSVSVSVIGLLVLAIPARSDTYCTKPTDCKPGLKQMYEGGKEKTVCLAWSGDADRAALALLLHVLTAQGFCHVALCEVKSLCDITADPPQGTQKRLMVGYGSVETQTICKTGYLVDVVGSEHFPGPRLHAAFSRSAALDAACFYPARTPTFYSNTSKLQACHFEQPLPVYVADSRDNNKTIEDRILQKNLPITIVDLILQDMNLTTRIYRPRAMLVDLLNHGNTSFLFIDSEIWSDEPRVRVIDLPDSRRFKETYLQSDKVSLLNYAPILFENIHQYRPQPQIIRELLALEDKQTSRTKNSVTAIKAAAQFKRQNETLFNQIAEPAKSRADLYRIEVIRCTQDNAAWKFIDSHNDLYDHIKTAHTKITDITNTMLVKVDISFETTTVDCLDHDELSKAVQKMISKLGFVRVLGVVAAGAGVPEAARVATLNGISLAAYDVQPPLSGPDYASLISAGPRVSALVSAVRQALAACNWRRAALLSEDTPAAAAVAVGLRANLNLGEKPLDNATLFKTLRELKAVDARVFVLNAGAEGVARALEAGAALRMTREEGYVWLARDRPAECPPLLALLAPRPADPGLAREVSKWSFATPMINALLTMMLGYTYLIHDFDKVRHDHHTNETLQKLREHLQKNLTTDNITGYNLTFDHEGVVPPLFQLEPYDYEASNTSTFVCFTGDGSRNCTLRTGNEFAPGTCLDLVVVLGAPAALLGTLLALRKVAGRRRKALRRREELLRAEACTALLQRQGGAVVELARYHVERARLRLLGELGAGRHGRVWLAEIVGEKGAMKGRYVAAKETHEGCAPVEESELLREAGTLAGLQHEHVLALVGVCVVGGPPLVLTEQALFGDLQGYLMRRRALCGSEHEEAAHVAAPALTRLAREASLALAYLASRGLVHCDVRAANCLVDEQRALKLADFGMARGQGTGEGAAPDEYQCQRRKLVPVRWMPPESLARGVFSPASDVWALGVLILELVTLGERPFGALGSPEAVALVKQGGHARLPASCSRDTRHLALACWRRDPATRPSAADTAAWLADRPTALAPAPHIHNTSQDSDDDSGFGETPPPDIT